MKIGIDLDDVVIEYVRGLTDYYNHVHFDSVRFDSIKEFDLKKAYPKARTPDEMAALMTSFAHHKHFAKLPSVDGAVDGLKELQGEGHTIYFVTARQSRAIDTTYRWLDMRGLPIERVYFNKDKGWLVNKLGLDMHIDDSLANLDSVTAQNGSKVRTIVYDRPWNRQFGQYAHERANNWSAVREMIRQ